jgi:hypothetical protein
MKMRIDHYDWLVADKGSSTPLRLDNQSDSLISIVPNWLMKQGYLPHV